MPGVALVHSPAMDSYDLGPWHPLKPERVTFTLALMRAYGLLADGDEAGPGQAALLSPGPADDDTIALVHSREYIEAVKEAGADPKDFVPRMGLGTGDNPVVPLLHEISAAIAGGAVAAMREVLDGRRAAAFNVAGGLHHAHRSRAAGFCVYNDPAIGMAWALERDPALRLMCVDIDAHHGDGVQEAFWDDARVLTVSIHESGDYLYPGTGSTDEIGGPTAEGFAVNVPLPPYANDACYRLAFEEVVAPLARRFRPDVLVTQNGADAHHSDPLTQLGLTLQGYEWLERSLRELSHEVSDGRLCAHGGGGYAYASAVPRAWTIALASLLERELPQELPGAWREMVRDATGGEPPSRLSDDDLLDQRDEDRLVAETARVTEEVRQTTLFLHSAWE